MRVPSLGFISDRYGRSARLYPALLVMAPAVLCVFSISSIQMTVLKSLGGVAAACGGVFLLAQLARDPGKNGEKQLFERWGGMPSVSILRHRDSRIDSITKARYHSKLSTLVKGTKPFTAEEELANATEADQVYAAWSTYLRTNTRDASKYPLIFDELVNYGYRRNTWGLRPFGIGISSLCCIGTAGWALFKYWSTGRVDLATVAAFGGALIFLLLWTYRFSDPWVRLAADAYAERLIESTDTLKATPTAKTKATQHGS
jgi:hypothetical protein